MPIIDVGSLGKILSPFNGIVLVAFASVAVMPFFKEGNFKFWLFGLAVGSIFASAVGDYLHHIIKNCAEKENNKVILDIEKTRLETEKLKRKII